MGDAMKQTAGHLDRELALFKERQLQLARDYYGKLVVIVGDAIEGYYDSELEAYTAARAKFGVRPLLIRRCVPPDEEVRHTFHSRVA